MLDGNPVEWDWSLAEFTGKVHANVRCVRCGTPWRVTLTVPPLAQRDLYGRTKKAEEELRACASACCVVGPGPNPSAYFARRAR